MSKPWPTGLVQIVCARKGEERHDLGPEEAPCADCGETVVWHQPSRRSAMENYPGYPVRLICTYCLPAYQRPADLQLSSAIRQRPA